MTLRRRDRERRPVQRPAPRVHRRHRHRHDDVRVRGHRRRDCDAGRRPRPRRARRLRLGLQRLHGRVTGGDGGGGGVVRPVGPAPGAAHRRLAVRRSARSSRVLAWSMPVLVPARLVQGLGGGLAIVAVYVVIGRQYPDDLRPKAFALLAAAWVLPAIIGPVIAGFLTDHVSWRAVFLVVPVLVLPPMLVMAPRLARLGGSLGDGDTPPRRGRLRLALVAAAGLAMLQEAGTRLGVIGALLAVAGPRPRDPVARPAPAARRPPVRARPPHRGDDARPARRRVLRRRGVRPPGAADRARRLHRPGGSRAHRGRDRLGARLAGPGPALRPGAAQQPWCRLGAVLVALCMLSMPLSMVASVPWWVGGISWLVGASGMGLCFGAIATLTLELSEPEDQGINSAALQVCDSVGSIVLVGVAGAIYAAAVAADSVTGWTFAAIWLLDGRGGRGRRRARDPDRPPHAGPDRAPEGPTRAGRPLARPGGDTHHHPARHVGRRTRLELTAPMPLRRVAPVAGLPARAPRGAAERLRAWQQAAVDEYLARQPRDFLTVATPGAGKTTYALRLASELLDRRVVERVVVVAPTEHLKTQWAEAAKKVGIPLDPEFSGSQGHHEQRLPRHRRHVRRRRGQHAALPPSRRGPQDARDPRRGAPRRRLAVVGQSVRDGCVCQRRTSAVAVGHAVPQRRQPDPVRHLRRRGATASAQLPPTTPTATATRCATTSCAR